MNADKRGLKPPAMTIRAELPLPVSDSLLESLGKVLAGRIAVRVPRPGKRATTLTLPSRTVMITSIETFLPSTPRARSPRLRASVVNYQSRPFAEVIGEYRPEGWAGLQVHDVPFGPAFSGTRMASMVFYLVLKVSPLRRLSWQA